MTTEAIEFDTYKLAIGFGLMFCYTMFMLGKLNVVEHRTYLAMTGQVHTKQSVQKSPPTCRIDPRMVSRRFNFNEKMSVFRGRGGADLKEDVVTSKRGCLVIIFCMCQLREREVKEVPKFC